MCKPFTSQVCVYKRDLGLSLVQQCCAQFARLADCSRVLMQSQLKMHIRNADSQRLCSCTLSAVKSVSCLGMLQEKVREQLGPQVTAFHNVLNGKQTLQSGDVLRLATKPVLIGKALFFIVGQVTSVLTLPCLLQLA